MTPNPVDSAERKLSISPFRAALPPVTPAKSVNRPISRGLTPVKIKPVMNEETIAQVNHLKKNFASIQESSTIHPEKLEKIVDLTNYMSK